jgi:PhnB protein
MQTVLNPYISFKDSAREAMEFYQSVFGGKLVMNTFSEYHLTEDPAEGNKIMHADLETENGFRLMGSDTPPGMEYTPGANVGISLSGVDEAELSAFYQKLSAGGTVTVPLEKAPWGDTFGMCTDKFGVNWMVNITGQSG